MVARLEKQAKDHRITASQIKTVCNELGVGDRVDCPDSRTQRQRGDESEAGFTR